MSCAQFLKRFVKNTPWAHLDIAGVTWSKKGSNFARPGGTGRLGSGCHGCPRFYQARISRQDPEDCQPSRDQPLLKQNQNRTTSLSQFDESVASPQGVGLVGQPPEACPAYTPA